MMHESEQSHYRREAASALERARQMVEVAQAAHEKRERNSTIAAIGTATNALGTALEEVVALAREVAGLPQDGERESLKRQAALARPATVSYADRVAELEELGCTTSDAQGAADVEAERGEILPPVMGIDAFLAEVNGIDLDTIGPGAVDVAESEANWTRSEADKMTTPKPEAGPWTVTGRTTTTHENIEQAAATAGQLIRDGINAVQVNNSAGRIVYGEWVHQSDKTTSGFMACAFGTPGAEWHVTTGHKDDDPELIERNTSEPGAEARDTVDAIRHTLI